MKKVLLSHFYNEEYLLPFWLKHHKNIFDDGILIDYNSTDKSVEIIKDICPNWKIYKSKNDFFSALTIDSEIIEYENGLEDGTYRMCLNTTEFLICNNKTFLEQKNNQILIPSFIMVDTVKEKYKDIEKTKSLISQRTNGIHFDKMFNFRRARSLHNYNINFYPMGRHYDRYTTRNAVICWYGFSPFNENIFNRKMQIQNKIPKIDKDNKWGHQHITDRQKIEKEYEHFLQYSCNLQDEIEQILGE